MTDEELIETYKENMDKLFDRWLVEKDEKAKKALLVKMQKTKLYLNLLGVY